MYVLKPFERFQMH